MLAVKRAVKRVAIVGVAELLASMCFLSICPVFRIIKTALSVLAPFLNPAMSMEFDSVVYNIDIHTV